MKIQSPKISILFLIIFCSHTLLAQNKMAAVKVVVAGTTHGHVSWILNRAKDSVIEIVGIYEPNLAVAKKKCAAI